MPHQCIHCGKLIEVSSKEILDGCAGCTSRFFFYIRDEKFLEMKKAKEELEKRQLEQEGHAEPPVLEGLGHKEKEKVEEEVRDILGIEDEEEPVILDLESVRVLSPGKFEIDLVSLMNKKPIVFKLEEGKYIIDISRLADSGEER
jgi:predicted  nucleic acid-binding Zn-ribbon protein